MLNKEGFADATPDTRSTLIDQAQECFALVLRGILEQEPLHVRIRGRTAEAFIRDLLMQAEAKGKTGDVAQYLVGAKLMLRFNRDIPVYPANKADRKSWLDQQPRYGDFEVGNGIIEVAVGLPDEKHIAQVVEVLQGTDYEVWLLTRGERVATWKLELEKRDGLDARRLVVTSVEAFIGQNLTELGEFSAKRKSDEVHALVRLYNTRWVEKVGTPGIRVVIK